VLSGTWTITGIAAAAAGTNMGHFRIKAGATTGAQGSITGTVTLTTNGITAANSNVLNFASTTGVVTGMNVTGAGIPTDGPVSVIATTGTTVTLNRASTAGVGSGVTITFRGDLYVDNVNIANGQVMTISAFTQTEGGA
jgi:hypothetical protein